MPIHLLWGDDTRAKERYIEKLIKDSIEQTWISMNLSRFNGKDQLECFNALQASLTPPFGSNARIIILKQSTLFNNCSNELASRFEGIVRQIPESTHLVCDNLNKPDGRLKTTKLIQQEIQLERASQHNYQLPAIWDTAGKRALIEKTANELKICFEEESILSLMDTLGTDSIRIEEELKKLALFEETKQKSNDITLISKKSVNELIEGISTNSLEIANFLLQEDYGEALFRLDQLMANGEPALRILATLTGQVRGWLWVSLLDKEKKHDINFIAKKAGISNPKRIYIIRKQIQNKSPSLFIKLLSKVLEAECLIKKGVPPLDAFTESLLSK